MRRSVLQELLSDSWEPHLRCWKQWKFGDMMSFERTDGRAFDELRAVRITPGYLPYAEGSVLIEMGQTRVVCSASVDERVPPNASHSHGAKWIVYWLWQHGELSRW